MSKKLISFFLVFQLFVGTSFLNASDVEGSSSNGFGQMISTVANYTKQILGSIIKRRSDLEIKIDEKRKMLQTTTKLVKKINNNLRQSTSYAEYLSKANERCRKNYDENIALVNSLTQKHNWNEDIRLSNLKKYNDDFKQCITKTEDLGNAIADIKSKLKDAKEFLDKQGLNEDLLKNDIEQLEVELVELTELVESRR